MLSVSALVEKLVQKCSDQPSDGEGHCSFKRTWLETLSVPFMMVQLQRAEFRKGSTQNSGKLLQSAVGVRFRVLG